MQDDPQRLKGGQDLLSDIQGNPLPADRLQVAALRAAYGERAAFARSSPSGERLNAHAGIFCLVTVAALRAAYGE
ncbi:MAG: hypothetical protein RMK99_16990, partial [Anaerolineales bacterium]|nr:hypothetical protein [Anaerolineales bacterium]